uniref:Uncharacterized protein n=1 Tax=Vitis vinifera TaxID=29760 RepID=F6GYR4_VITVI
MIASFIANVREDSKSRDESM